MPRFIVEKYAGGWTVRDTWEGRLNGYVYGDEDEAQDVADQSNELGAFIE